MKRMTAGAAALAILLSLSGCAGGQGAQSAAGSGAVQEGQSPQTVQAAAQTLWALPSSTGGFWGTNSGDAYYEIALIGDSYSRQGVILKTDYAGAQQTCLCQKEGCAHSDATCNAFLERWPGLNLCVINDTLYSFYTAVELVTTTPEQEQLFQEAQVSTRASLDTDEERQQFDEQIARDKAEAEKSAGIPSYIEALSTDGQQKTRLVEFPREWSVSFAYTDGTKVYGSFASGDYTASGRNKTGVWADLSTGAYDTFPIGDSYAMYGTFQNQIVLNRVVSEQDLQALQNEDAYRAALLNSKIEFVALNPSTGEQTILAQFSREKQDLFLSNDRLYYRESTAKQPQELYEFGYLDLATGQETVLQELRTQNIVFDNMLKFSNLLPIGTGQAQRYFRCIGSDVPEKRSFSQLFDVQTNEFVPIGLHAPPDGVGDTSAALAAQTNDGRFLVKFGRMDTPVHERSRYILIAPEDYLAGNANYTEVSMYETK